MKISVIMPAYNCEKSISKCIESVLKQEFDDFELIIIDDGSTDSTYEICKSINNKRINVVHQENKGPSSARNLGLSLAKGKYVMFIDADDFYSTNALMEMYELIENEKVDLVTGSYNVMYEDHLSFVKLKDSNKFKKKYDYIDYLQKKGALNSNWNKIYVKELIDKHNIKFDINKEIGEDVRFNFEYIKYATKFVVSSKIIYNYNISEYGLTKKNDESKVKRLLAFLIYQNDYYVELNLNTSRFQRKIFKYFFHIYNKDEKINNEFDDFILKIKNKIIRIKILNWLCQKKKKLIIKLMIDFYNKMKKH